MRFRFLMENKTDGPGCIAEHGLSIYIETQGRRILFDTGASGLFVQNAEKLGVDLGRVDDVVISHGHYDHTGGVPAFCDCNKTAPIYIHKNAFHETYGLEQNGEWEKEPCSIRWTQEQRQAMEPRIVRTDGVTRISDTIVISLCCLI